MKQVIFKVTIITYFVLSAIIQMAQAQTTKYIVLPFKVNAPAGYMYLEKAIPSMLTSRLYKAKYFQPVSEVEVARINKSFTIENFEEVQKKICVDIIIGGDISIIGDDAVIDVYAYRDNVIAWKQHKNTKVNDLIAALQELTDEISQNFVKAGSEEETNKSNIGAPSTSSSKEAYVSTQKQQDYCNPQFHYQEANEFKHSQSLPFASIGLVVADVTGNKKNEVILLGERKVYVYRWEDGCLNKLGEYQLPRLIKPIVIRGFDFDGDGVQDIIVSGYDTTYGKPFSLVLSFKDNVFKEISSNIPFYMNVVKLPPDFSPIVIGQKSGSAQVFARQGVCRVERYKNTFSLGSQLLLPLDVNVFSFSWVPGSSPQDENRLVGVNSREQIVVYGSTGSKLFVTGEIYYGSSVGIDEPTNMPGLGISKNIIPTKYYIPIRMVPIYLEKKKSWGLLVCRSISVAAQFFENYRSFSEGEIQTLFWDGMGLATAYKTEVVKGTITDFTVVDINNDGEPELVISVNSYIGPLGLGKSRTTVIFSSLEGIK